MTTHVLFRRPVALAFLTLLVVAGCQKQEATNQEAKGPDDAQPKGSDTRPVPPTPSTSASDVPPAVLSRLHQPFKDAVLLDPPDGEQLLDKTCAGKSVGKLFEAVAGPGNSGGLWDQVRFVTPQGKKIEYRAVLTTDLGPVHVQLYPESAPNHVRSFVALARAGYFDGLPFYRSLRELDDDGKTVATSYIEAGCPKGTGEYGYGSIGYWLKPELENNKLVHEEGSLAAWHREEAETAACRFYIATQKMPHLDGAYTVFGKVTHGLDVIRTIANRPVEDVTSYRLKEMVPIRSVAIETTEVDGPVASQ